MNAEALKNAYQAFFLKSEAGKHFTDEVIRLIVDQHEKAEKNPELARDHTQTARGVRMIKDHIDSVVAVRSKQG